MKVDKVTYTKSYSIGPFLQEKVGFEASIDPEDIPENVLNYLKVMADQWHKENNPHLDVPMYEQTIPDMQVDAPKSRNEKILAGISTCNDITVLKSYSLLAKQDEATLLAYNKKLEELSK